MRQKAPPTSFVSLRRIFLSQCIDHSLSLGFGLFLFFVALSLIQSPTLETLANAGPTFWIGFFSTLFFAGLMHRAFFVMLFGSTFGNLCFHVRPSRLMSQKGFWIGQAYESLQVAIPALWVLELIFRNQRSRYSGIRYTFDFS